MRHPSFASWFRILSRMAGSQSSKSGKSHPPTPLKDRSLSAIAELIKNGQVKKIIVMTGAGISTAAGIPDFRSKGTGLYDNLQKFNLPYPEAIFDIDFFMDNPKPFYALAKEIYPGKYYPTKTHYFIRLLHEKGLLLRNFTQNIDTLERLAGLDEERIVEAHGSFATASCVECRKKTDMEMLKHKVASAEVACCEDCGGYIKPDITFFGESLPSRFFKQLNDFDEADLLIVIGTSLQVQPFASLIENVSDNVPRLLINKELVGVYNSPKQGFDFKWKYGKKRDVAYLGDCDEGIQKLAELLGWQDELERLYTEGNKKLKAIWAAEQEARKEEEEEEPEKPDKEIEALAEDLEKRLHVPANRQESEERLKQKDESSSQQKL